MLKILKRLYLEVGFVQDWVVHFAVALVYLGLITVLSPHPALIYFGPLVIGTFMIDLIDHPVFVYLTNRHQETSIQTRKLIDSGQFIEGIKFWSDNHKKENKLIIHSILGQPVLALTVFYLAINKFTFPLFYVLLGMFLHTLVDQTLDIKRMRHLRHWFFWPLPAKIEVGSMVTFYTIMVTIFVASSIYLVR